MPVRAGRLPVPRTHALQGGDLLWVNHNTRGLRGSPDLQAWSSGLGHGDSASCLEGGGSIRVQASLTRWEQHYHEARRGHTSAADQPAPRPCSPGTARPPERPTRLKTPPLLLLSAPAGSCDAVVLAGAPAARTARSAESESPAWNGGPCDVLTASSLAFPSLERPPL